MYGSPKASVKFPTLPDVLVQDPVRQCCYLIPADSLTRFRVRPADFLRLGSEAVTFVIPDDEFIEQVPPFLKSQDALPSVLVQHPAGSASYFLTYEELQLFKVPEGTELPSYGIAFVIPTGMELIEDLPPLMRAALQSGESGCIPLPICPPGGHSDAPRPLSLSESAN